MRRIRGASDGNADDPIRSGVVHGPARLAAPRRARGGASPSYEWVLRDGCTAVRSASRLHQIRFMQRCLAAGTTHSGRHFLAAPTTTRCATTRVTIRRRAVTMSVSRRQFLHLIAVGSGAALLSACSSAPAAAPRSPPTRRSRRSSRPRRRRRPSPPPRLAGCLASGIAGRGRIAGGLSRRVAGRLAGRRCSPGRPRRLEAVRHQGRRLHRRGRHRAGQPRSRARHRPVPGGAQPDLRRPDRLERQDGAPAGPGDHLGGHAGRQDLDVQAAAAASSSTTARRSPRRPSRSRSSTCWTPPPARRGGRATRSSRRSPRRTTARSASPPIRRPRTCRS